MQTATLVKSDAARELLIAVNAVLKGKRFVSPSLADYGLDATSNRQTADDPHSDVVIFTQPQKVAISRHHEVGFILRIATF